MSVEGLCQICESAPARHRCDRCGNLVCNAHFDEGAGLCSDCAADLDRQRPGQDGGPK
ncbi:MAG: hypothetical protein ABEI06_09455 [Halobacteriaceae archaeon]